MAKIEEEDKASGKSMQAYLKEVERYISSHHLISNGGKVVTGVSGGPDSVCLALMLHMLGYEVVAIHCNFHLRGEESMRDEAFSEDLCRKNGIRFMKVDFDTTGYAKREKVSIEMAARDLRYAEFRRVKQATGAECIAVGHHKNDNIETMVLNMVRGTGIKGLCGMQPKNGDVVRPLLCLTRPDVLGFLHACGQTYVTDHTNLEDEYARNKVRLNMVPMMESINAGALNNISSTMENLNEVYKIYKRAIGQDMLLCSEEMPDGEIRIDKEKLMRSASPISVLHELLGERGFNKAELKDMLTSGCGRVFGEKGQRVAVDRTRLIVESAHYPAVEIEERTVDIGSLKMERDNRHAYLDADKLHGKLTMRFPQQGDSFAPFGMKGKRKLLSDYMTDQKMSVFEKERQPLLMDGEEIAWVAGRRSSELYRVDGQTRRVVILCLKS